MRIRLRSKGALAVTGGLVLLAAVATAPLYASGGGGTAAAPNIVKVDVHNANGALVGKVRLAKQGQKVIVNADITGLTPGFHGFHVHAVGECVPPFTSAGGHFNPTGVGHGQHAGDMPPLFVTADGVARAEFATDSFTIAQLFDADGSAIIVHALPDNLAHIPTRYQSTTEGVLGPDSATLATGDAGARVACGVVG
jgi:Cu-Zn family superoxide dismutase